MAPPCAAWSAVALTLLTTQFVSRMTDPGKSLGALDGWVQFDGPEYLSIATNGYSQRQLVWFPGYPMVVRAFDAVLGGPIGSGVLVSAAAGLIAALLFWRWTELMALPSPARGLGLAVMLLYPYAWFLYGVVYSDALFLMLVLSAFLLVERRHLVWAGAVGALATATRPAGFALILGLALLALERDGALRVPGPRAGWVHALRLPVVPVRSGFNAAHLGPLISLIGLGSWMLYQWVAWGSPLRFVSEQSNYHDSGRATLFKQQYFEAWYSGFDARHLATTTFQAVLLLAVLASVCSVGRRFGWGYGVFVLGLAVLPSITVSTFMGVGRYLLPAFPCFALVGEWLVTRRRWRVIWFALSGAALLVMSFGFARSWYLT